MPNRAIPDVAGQSTPESTRNTIAPVGGWPVELVAGTIFWVMVIGKGTALAWFVLDAPPTLR